MHIFRTQILENQLDTLGHVNNSEYMVLFELARWEFITQKGYGLNYVREVQRGPIVLEANIKYRQELKLREKIEIQTEMLDYKKKLGHLKQRIIGEDNRLCAEALFTIALFDIQARKIIEPTQAWRQALMLSDQDED